MRLEDLSDARQAGSDKTSGETKRVAPDAPDLHLWIEQHCELLGGIDNWFVSLRSRYSGKMQCGRGCTLCCYGLFDISLPDAFLLVQGLGKLPAGTLAQVKARAAELHATLLEIAPELKAPFFLLQMSQERIDEIVHQARSPRCPLLGGQDECLAYENRPLACRLEGAPMVDIRDGIFGDWCELNFVDGLPEQALNDLRLDYCGLREAELSSAEVLSRLVPGGRAAEATIFIPSLVVDYERFWEHIIGR